MSLDFPWQMFGQAAEAQTRNRRQAMEDAQGIGQNVSGFADKALAFSRQKALKDIISKMLAGQQGAAQPGAAPQTAGMGGAMTAAPKPSMASDPQLSPILQMLQADPSLIPETLPALAKGMSHKSSGMTDFQTSSLEERKKEFEQRMKMQSSIQEFKQGMERSILALRKAGQNTQADRLQAQLQEWTAQHFMLSYMGLGPQLPSTPESSSQGWDAEPEQ